MAKFSNFGKALLGYLTIKAGKTIVEDQLEARKRRKEAEFFCGYRWPQITTILTQCCASHEDTRTFLRDVTDPVERNRFVEILLTMPPYHFSYIYGFDRPAPV